MTRRLTISAALVAALIAMPGAAATIRGHVASKGNALPGVMVTMIVDGRTITRVTNTQGEYVFEDVAAESGVITAELSGFRSVKKTFAVTAAGEVQLSFELKTQRFEPLTIACGPARYEHGSIFVMSQSEANRLPLGH